MHKKATILIGLILFSILLPYLFTLFFTGIIGNQQLSPSSLSSGITILLTENGEDKTMDMEEFLVGAIPGELPLDYDPKMYKVMADILRTTIKKNYVPGEMIHADTLGIRITDKTESGYVKTVALGDKSMTGDEFVKALSLLSSCFYLEKTDTGIQVISLGKGHGMGLSLYGGNEMAKDGATYKKILHYYYKNRVNHFSRGIATT